MALMKYMRVHSGKNKISAGAAMIKHKLNFFSFIFFLINSSLSICSGNQLNGSNLPSWLKTGTYASYRVEGLIELTSGEIIDVNGTLSWYVVNVSDRIDVKVTLSLSNITRSIAFFIEGDEAFVNGEKFGKIPFWIGDIEEMENVILSGNPPVQVEGEINKKYNHLVKISNKYYDALRITVTQNVNSTQLTSDYFYGRNNKLLVQVVGACSDPVLHLFGIRLLFGGITIASTNVDLGPENLTVYLVSFVNILLIPVPIIIGVAVVYIIIRRVKGKYSENARRSKSSDDFSKRLS